MINKRNHQCSKRKIQILNLISINIYEELSLSRKKHKYFLKIIDNYFQRTWFISFHKQSNAITKLREWKLKVELKNETILQTIKNDNAKKLKAVLNKWCESIEIISQYIVLYNLIQNDVIERNIKITKNQIRAMIKNAELSIEFWFEIDKINVYIQNRVDIDSMMNENSTTLIEAFIEVKSSIDHFRVWSCKCYVFENSKSLTSDRKNKFMHKRRFCVFLEYIEKTNTQYLMWTSDCDWIKHHKMIFVEEQKWKFDNLNFSICIENVFLIKQSIEKSFEKNSTTNIISIIRKSARILSISTKFINFTSFDKFSSNKTTSINDHELDQANDRIFPIEIIRTIEKFLHVILLSIVISFSSRVCDTRSFSKNNDELKTNEKFSGAICYESNMKVRI